MTTGESEATKRCELTAEKAALLADNDEHEAAIAQNNVRLTVIRKELVKLYRMENELLSDNPSFQGESKTDQSV